MPPEHRLIDPESIAAMRYVARHRGLPRPPKGGLAVESALSPSRFKLLACLGGLGVLLLLAIAPGATLAKAPTGARHAAANPTHHAHRRRPAACRPGKRHRCPTRRPRHRKAKPKPKKVGAARRPTPPPGVATGAPQTVTGSSATVVGRVNPNGNPARYWFQYGTSTGYGARTPALAAGSGRSAQPVSAALSQLAPLATYHVRIVASTCNGCGTGTAYGQDATFATNGYGNPVYGAAEAADPFVLDNGGTHHDYWSFTTGNLFPILHSTDLVHWTSVGTAMTARPAWVLQSGDWHPWAPNVVNVNESCPGTSSPSCYVMFYVGLSTQFSTNCVAVATATGPAGPYTDQGPLSNGRLDAAGRPIGCGDDSGYGMIDPSVFIAPSDGRPYLYGSEDFACAAGSTSCTAENSTLRPTLSVIPLAFGLLSAAGGRTPLLSGDAGTWEAAGVAVPTVEGPTAMLHNGTYYLLYSGGGWRSQYGMGYATAPAPLGPFTKATANPILSGTPAVLGPGGGDTPVVGPGGGTWLVYHGRDVSDSNPRTLRIDPFSWRSVASAPDAPVLSGPTSTAQPLQP